MVDYSKPIKMSTGQPAKVLAVTDKGAWVTWGSETVAFCFDQKGVAQVCRKKVVNVPEKREYYLQLGECLLMQVSTLQGIATHKITICGKACRIEKL